MFLARGRDCRLRCAPLSSPVMRPALPFALLLAACAPNLAALRAPPSEPSTAAPSRWSPDVMAHFLAAQVALRSGDGESRFPLAIEELGRALALAPKEPALWRATASVHAQRGDNERAVEHARHALELDHEDPRSAYLLGEQLLRLDRAGEAEPFLVAATARSGVLEQPSVGWYHLYLARRQLDRSDEALSALDGWRAALPSDSAPLPLRASLLWHLGRAPLAAEAAVEALRRSPQTHDEEPRRILKEALALEPQVAARRLEEVVAMDWSAGRVHRDLVELWSDVGRWDQALEHARAAAILSGEDDGGVTIAGILVAMHRPEEARVLLEEGLARLPVAEHPAIRIGLAEAQDATGAWKKAATTLDLVPADDERGLEAQWRKAVILSARSGPGPAITAVTEALALAPDVLPRASTGLLELGIRAARAGRDLAQARRWVEALERSAPERALPWRALINHDEGAPGIAEILAEDAARAASLDAAWLGSVATALRELGEGPRGTALLQAALPRLDAWLAARPTEDPLQRFRLSVEAENRRTAIELVLADQLVADQRQVDAETLLRGLLQRRPDYATALNYLGFLLADQGRNLEEAHQLIDRALAQRPFEAAYRDSLGWVLLRQGDAQAAVPVLEEAFAQSAGDPEVADHLGEALLAVGNRRRAAEIFRQAIAGARPDDPRHRTVVARVKAKLGG